MTDSRDPYIKWPSPSKSNLRKLSKFIEACLFACASNNDEYWDVFGVEERVEKILMIYYKRFRSRPNQLIDQDQNGEMTHKKPHLIPL